MEQLDRRDDNQHAQSARDQRLRGIEAHDQAQPRLGGDRRETDERLAHDVPLGRRLPLPHGRRRGVNAGDLEGREQEGAPQ